MRLRPNRGFSPLTLFYPAARSPANSAALREIFWYDLGEKCWRDPTHSESSNHGRLAQEACAYVAAWLDKVLTKQAGGQRLAALNVMKLAAEDDRFSARLLADWRGELESFAAGTGALVQEAPLVKSLQLKEVERSAGKLFQVPQGSICQKSFT